jgi:hypothetical protein
MVLQNLLARRQSIRLERTCQIFGMVEESDQTFRAACETAFFGATAAVLKQVVNWPGPQSKGKLSEFKFADFLQGELRRN